MDIIKLIELFKNTRPNPGSIVELEVRLRDVDLSLFQEIFNKFVVMEDAQAPIFECSVIISDTDADVKERRELYYEDGVLSQEKFIRKKRLTKNIVLPHNMVSNITVIGLNMETPIDSFEVKPTNTVRFRSRCSFNFTWKGLKWRLDMTVIKQGILKEMEKSLPRIRGEFCKPDLGVDNFLKHIINIGCDAYEVEIEYLDDPAKITPESFDVVNTIVQSNKLLKKYEIIQKCQAMLGKPTNRRVDFRDLFPAVESLNRGKYKEIFPPENYYLTIKADGIRAWIALDGNKLYLLNSNDGVEREIVAASKERVIVDVEQIGDVYYIIDVVMLGTSMMDEPLSARLSHVPRAIEILSPHIVVKPKEFILIKKDNLEKQFKEVYHGRYDFEADGLILSESDKPYGETTSYKWKPYDHNTIDFYCVKLPDDLVGESPYIKKNGQTLYILFNGITHFMREKIGLGLIKNYKRLIPKGEHTMYPVQFSPSIMPLAYIFYHEDANLNNEIVELTRNKANTDWILVKIRRDRMGEKNYYGNKYRTAEATFLNFYDLFPFEALWTNPGSYFNKTVKRDDTLFNTNKFNRLVINILFKKYVSGAHKVLDLAFGQGADINRYKAVGVKEILGVDQDASAIVEATNRKYGDLKRKFVGSDEELSACEKEYARIQAIEYNKLITVDVKSMIIHTMITNLKNPYCDTCATMRTYGYNIAETDVVVCNLAFHYMCDMAKNIDNFFSIVATQLKVNGFLVMTTMNGRLVFDLIGKDKWEYAVDGVAKYRLERRNKGTSFASYGQNIAVLLPMTEQMVEEPLCNFEYVIDKAKKFGLVLIENKSFGDYTEATKTDLTANFTKEDWTYVGLYHSLVFRKDRELKRFTKV
jgi:hypothetical protein